MGLFPYIQLNRQIKNPDMYKQFGGILVLYVNTISAQKKVTKGLNHIGGQMNSYQPSFSRLVSSPNLAVSNECNVLAGEQDF